ncbi:MAG TPA: IPT/TIG domain-containing protein [Bacteroidia bacterium]|nr:IPT/TIG domain-containing protein [Bacteroidia bacterium]
MAGKHIFYTFLAAAFVMIAACNKSGNDNVQPAAPTVYSLTPDTGKKGTVVLISGKGFSEDSTELKVYFNGRIAQLLQSTDTTITAVVPPGAGPGSVTVSLNGVSAPGPVFNFIYTFTVSLFSGSVQGFANGSSGTSKYSFPKGMAIDAQDNIYLADEGNERIRVIYPNGTSNTFSGSGMNGFLDGPPGVAKFNHPVDITYDRINQEFYIADRDNHCIRKLSSSGGVSTVAGIPATPGYVDGAATAARLNTPTGVEWKGELLQVFICDYGNHCIRKLDNVGILSTFAGTNIAGLLDGTGTAARFNGPFDISWDSTGYLFVTDFTNHTIRRISESGAVITYAGNGVPGFTNGISFVAEFRNPAALSASQKMTLVCDQANNCIRLISNNKVITAAGTGVSGFADGDGSVALFNAPGGIVRDSQGNYFISDTQNHVIRKMVLD